MTTAEHRFIPAPTLPRDELTRRLHALGYRRVADEPRTHLESRRLGWEHPGGSHLVYVEHHIVGDRYLIAEGKLPEGLPAAVESVHRLVLLQEAESAPGLAEAMVALRRLCLLEREAPSADLRAWLDRVCASSDLFVRMAAASAVASLEPGTARERLARMATSEPNRSLRAVFKRLRSALGVPPGPTSPSPHPSIHSTDRSDMSTKAKGGQAARGDHTPAITRAKQAPPAKPKPQPKPKPKPQPKPKPKPQPKPKPKPQPKPATAKASKAGPVPRSGPVGKPEAARAKPVVGKAKAARTRPGKRASR